MSIVGKIGKHWEENEKEDDDEEEEKLKTSRARRMKFHDVSKMATWSQARMMCDWMRHCRFCFRRRARRLKIIKCLQFSNDNWMNWINQINNKFQATHECEICNSNW